MPDTFAITIIFIIVCTVVGAFIKGRTKDRCLDDFSGFRVTLERADGKTVWGKLRVENSGLELIYDKPYFDEKDGHAETSYILYKNEYGDLRHIVCYLDELDPAKAELRAKSLEKTTNPAWHSRLTRRVRNVFGTVRDSILEVFNLFMGKMKSAGSVGKLLQGQDKYIAQMQQQAFSAVGSAYEPILERYLGKRVIMAVVREGKKKEYEGILKDYTTEFIELLDIKYKEGGEQKVREADILVPRALGTVRHSGV